MDPSLLDTDILSEFLKERNAAVAANALAYLQQHGQFTISAMTRFEIRRGYLEKKASRRIARFDVFCGHSIVLPITDSIFDRASDLWVQARQSGHSHGDADLLIAATALEHNLILVPGNHEHFDWMPGLKIDDWRAQ